MPRNVQKDPEASHTWLLKDDIVRRGRVYYAKLARGKAMFIAPRMVPYFHALWGVRRADEPRRPQHGAHRPSCACCARSGKCASIGACATDAEIKDRVESSPARWTNCRPR